MPGVDAAGTTPGAPTGPRDAPVSAPVGRGDDVEGDVLLADGSTAHVRAIAPEDADALRAFHARLSPESVMLRFFGPHPRLSDAEVERFTRVDGEDRLALVAERGGQLVAVARYDRAPGSDDAEVAFVVDDAFQGRGLGTILLEHLASAARRRGVRRFVADTLSENFRMLGVFRDAGFARQFTRSSEVMRVVLDIAPSPEAREAAEERDRRAVVRSMHRLLRPSSIAVVGASPRAGTVGHRLVANLLAGGFRGPVYPVHPSAGEVAGVPAWARVEDVPGPVDLAVVAVPGPAVTEVVEGCGRKGVGALVVVSGGFAEADEAGAARQRALAKLAHAQGMRMVGPLCSGVVNTAPEVSMNATFAPLAPVAGPIGFGSQSAGLGIAVLAEASARGLGVSSFVSLGLKADVSGNDLLSWWEEDPDTRVVVLYVESFGNPRRFGRIARRVSRTKPVLAVKSGHSAPATAATASERAVDALFHHTGVVRTGTIEELLDAAAVLALQPLPRGPRVAVVGTVGGPGVLAADACVGHGLAVPPLSPSTQAALRPFVPEGATVANPVHLVPSASPEHYRGAIGALARADEVDALLVVVTPPPGGDAAPIAAAAAEAVEGRELTVVASFLGAAEGLQAQRGGARPVPCFTYPESAARALARAVEYARWRASDEGTVPALEDVDANAARRLLEAAAGGGRAGAGAGPVPEGWIAGEAATGLLRTCGIPCLPTVSAGGARQAAEAAGRLGFPAVLKATSAGTTRPYDPDRAAAGLRSRQAVYQAYEHMARHLGAAMDGAVVQPEPGTGVATTAGFVQDPAFGPLVVFGLGGPTFELLDDRVTRLAPLTDVDARELVLSVPGAALLTGDAGQPAVDLDALVDVVLRMSRLAEDLPEVAEGWCDPLLAAPGGAVAVDARFRLTALPDTDDRRRLT